MFSKSAKLGDNAPAAPPVHKKAPTPIVSEEADRAIYRVQVRYAMTAFALAVFGVVLLAIVGAKFPHNPFLMRALRSRAILIGVSCLWLIPFVIGQFKQSVVRLQFARKYAEQQRWSLVAAALRSFTEWGQRSYDRDGEAHYLLAQAYDRLNRKEQARKMREFIRKHRSSSEWAKRIGAGPNAIPAGVSLSRAKKTPGAGSTAGDTDPAPRRLDRAPQSLAKPTRRKRF